MREHLVFCVTANLLGLWLAAFCLRGGRIDTLTHIGLFEFTAEHHADIAVVSEDHIGAGEQLAQDAGLVHDAARLLRRALQQAPVRELDAAVSTDSSGTDLHN